MPVFVALESPAGGAMTFPAPLTGVELAIDARGLRQHQTFYVLAGPMTSEDQINTEVARLIGEIEAGQAEAKRKLKEQQIRR